MPLRHTTLGLALIVLATAPPASRAQPPAVDGADFTVAAAERDQFLDRLAKELQDAYAFPDVAEKMVADMKTKRAEYETITSGPALASKLTTNLQAISKDKHLRVRASATPFPKPPKEGPTAAERDRAKEFSRRMNGAILKVERLPGNIGYLRSEERRVGKEGRSRWLQNDDTQTSS